MISMLRIYYDKDENDYFPKNIHKENTIIETNLDSNYHNQSRVDYTNLTLIGKDTSVKVKQNVTNWLVWYL